MAMAEMPDQARYRLGGLITACLVFISWALFGAWPTSGWWVYNAALLALLVERPVDLVPPCSDHPFAFRLRHAIACSHLSLRQWFCRCFDLLITGHTSWKHLPMAMVSFSLCN